MDSMSNIVYFLERFMLVFLQILPIFLFVLLGYGFKQIKYDISKELVEFVMFFSLPALAIVQIHELDIDSSLFGVLYVAYSATFIAFGLSLAVGYFLKLSRKNLVTLMIVVIFGNTSFVGFSYIESFYGSEDIVYGLIYDQIASFLILLTFGVVLISWGGGANDSPKEILKKIFFSPPLLAIIFAFTLRDIAIPEFFMIVLKKIELTLIPLVTIIVGMKLELRDIFKEFKLSFIAVFMKLLLVPFIVIFGISFLFGDIEPRWLKISLLEVTMPTMTMATVFAIEGGLNKQLAINALALSILISFITIPLWNIIVN